MSALRILAAAALASACCTQGKPPPSGEPPATTSSKGAPALPRASGPVTVRGGETIELDGARVTVGVITHLDQPCPPDVQCLHSGVIKRVELRVAHGGAPVLASLAEGERRVVDGVELSVRAVRAGPEADVEASLPLAPAP